MLLPLKPVCEQKDIRNNGTSLIYIQYCYSRKHRTNLNTEIAIPPQYWNKKKLSVKDTLPITWGNWEHLNTELKRMMRLVEDLVDLADKKNISNKGRFVKDLFTPSLNLEELGNNDKKLKELAGEASAINLDIYLQIDEYIKSKLKKVSPSTITVFENVKSHLKAFETFRQEPISFKSFDFNFYDTYVDFLTFDYVQTRFKKNPVVGMKLNTVGKTIKQLKIFLKDRIRRKIIAPIDLSDYKVPDEETDAIYLKLYEIAAIYHTDLTPYPELVGDRNWFVVACLTGLRFSDFSTISPADLRGGLLHKKQHKSDHWVVIPLQKEAQEILDEIFMNNVPISSNPDFNKNIKTIGKLAGINALITFTHKKGNEDVKVTKAKCDWITSHTARRSFCTNEFLAGTPVKLIMQISGHKREKDFYRYIRITPEEAAETIKKIWMERNNMEAFPVDIKNAS